MEAKTSVYVEQLERKVATLTRLLEVTAVLNTAMLNHDSEVDALLTYLMDAAAEITGSQAASVLLWDDRTHQLYFAATTSDNKDAQALIGKPVPMGNSVAGAILTERKAIAINDAINDDRVYTKVDEDLEFVTRSLLGVPMISKENVIGVLEVVNKKQLPWKQDDQNNLILLAEEAAVAIEVAQLVIALRGANKELSEVDKLKSDFIAIASHELRTPLSVILGYASFLQEEESAEVSGHATKVMQSALQLRRIIEDMVNLRYLKQSQSELKREPLRISQIIDDLKQDVLALTDASEHSIIIRQDDDANVLVDRSRISMALTNVLNNAVRFTPVGGSINIQVSLNNEAEVWVVVNDSGVGIAPEHLKHIFDEFFQVEDHMTRHHGGLGIGLSISRALIEAHDGRIWATSDGIGAGTTFTIALPVHSDNE